MLRKIKFKIKKEKIKVYVEKLIDINIPCHRYFYALFLLFDKLDFRAMSEKVLYKAISLKSKAIYHYRLGILLKRKKEWEQVVETLGKAIEMNPSADIEWHLAYAEALEKMNRFEEASVVLEKFAKNETLDSDGYFTYGNLLKKTLKIDQAQMAFSRAIELDTSKESKELGIGIFYEKKGRWIEALEAYKEEVERQPENALIYYKLGLSYDRCYDWENAEEFFVKAISMDTTNAHWFYRLGFVRERQGKWKEAEESYRFALERQNKFYPSWYYRLGFVLEKQGKSQEATVAFKEQRVLQEAYGITETTYNKNQTLKRIVNYTEYYERYELEEEMVLYESFGGKGFSDNPYALFNQMIVHPSFRKWKFIWVLNDKENLPKKYRGNKSIICVKRNSDLYLRYLSSSKVLINNAVFPTYFIKKKEQVYINTWHGTPWKTLGNDNPMQSGNTARNFMQADYLISPNAYTSNILINRYGINGLFQGELFESGYPRIDSMLTISNNSKDNIKKILNIHNNKPIVLYAPTYKGFWKNPNIESNQIIEYLDTFKSENYNLIFRGHYFTEENLLSRDLGVTVAHHHIDTCELLSVVDILITDYSSILFDFLPLNNPIFLFIPDYDTYKKERGLYLDVDQIPATPYKDIYELKQNIEKSIKDSTKYRRSNVTGIEKFIPYEDGNSSKRVIDKLIYRLEGKKTSTKIKERDSMIIYPGHIEDIEDLSILKDFISQISDKEIDVFVLFNSTELVKNQEIRESVEEIEKIKGVLEFSGRKNMTLEERWLDKKIKNGTLVLNKQNENILNKLYAREYRRLFNEKKFTFSVVLNPDNTHFLFLLSKINISNSFILNDDFIGLNGLDSNVENRDKFINKL